MIKLHKYESKKKKDIRRKNGKSDIAPLRLSTLASFQTWGSSIGAGRILLPLRKIR